MDDFSIFDYIHNLIDLVRISLPYLETLIAKKNKARHFRRVFLWLTALLRLIIVAAHLTMTPTTIHSECSQPNSNDVTPKMPSSGKAGSGP